MLYLKRILFLIVSVFFITACTNNTQQDPTFDPTGNSNTDLNLVKLSSSGIMDQNPSNRAKEILSNYAEVSGVRAVNDKDEILIAIDVNHQDRFSLDNIESQLQKKIRKNFSDLKVTLSTDEKILIELEKLEKDIEANKISNEQLKKKIAELKSLSKEET